MPEGDAVWRTARRLHEVLAGEVVTDWELRWPGTPSTSARGRRTLEVVPRGKHILHRLDGGVTLHTHLRMDGRWRLRDPRDVTARDLRNPDLRALVGCSTATALGIELGMVDVVATRDERRYVGHLGPDLLGIGPGTAPDDNPARWDAGVAPAWDPRLAVTNLRGTPERAIGAALLDQRNLTGMGTIWLAETLWAQRQHPWTPIHELDDEQLRGIVDRARALLTGTLAYGSCVSTGVDLDGERLHAFERTTLPCRRCGTAIRSGRIGAPPADRAMYWCPTCQGGLAPGDNGRPQRPVSVRGIDAAARARRRTGRHP